MQRLRLETVPPGATVTFAGQTVTTPAVVTVVTHGDALAVARAEKPGYAPACKPVSVEPKSGGFPDPIVVTLSPLDPRRTLRPFPSDDEILREWREGAFSRVCQGGGFGGNQHFFDGRDNNPDGAYEPQPPPPGPPPHVVTGPTFRGLEFDYDVPGCDSSPPPCEGGDGILFTDNLVSTVGSNASVEKLNGKLASLTFRIEVGAFSDIATMFAAKYGKPALSYQEPWQSKGGVETTSQVRFWKWKGLQLYLKAPSDDVDHGVVIVKTDELARIQDKEHTERLLKGLGDL